MFEIKGHDFNTNRKLDEAIELLDTETVAHLLSAQSLSQKEVLNALNYVCRKECLKYCTQEYKACQEQEHIFTALYVEMSRAVFCFVDDLSSYIKTAFEERCVKNNAFDRLNKVTFALAKAAIDKCWYDFVEMLDYVEKCYSYEFVIVLTQHVYETTLAK